MHLHAIQQGLLRFRDYRGRCLMFMRATLKPVPPNVQPNTLTCSR
jgi:hypothetical protein